MNVSRPGFLAATGLDLTPFAAPPLMIFSYIDNLYVQYGVAVELDRQLGAHPAGVGVGEDHRVRGEAERSAVPGGLFENCPWFQRNKAAHGGSSISGRRGGLAWGAGGAGGVCVRRVPGRPASRRASYRTKVPIGPL